MKFRNVILVVLIASSQLIFAQNADNKFAVSLYGGLNHYKGDLGNGLKEFAFKNPLGALSLSTYLSPSFDLGVQGSYGKIAYKGSYFNSIQAVTRTVDFGAAKYEGFMYLDYKLANGYLFSKKSFISPILTTGIGLAGYKNIAGKELEKFPTDLIVPVGAGLKFNLSQKFAITYRYLYVLTNHDDHDLAKTDASNDFFGSKSDAYGEHLLGLAISLGAPKDSDKDGVPDKKDQCPNTPKGVKVDIHGCPLDGDADGIADYVDKCPTVFGVKQFEGCPDTDGDGVQDSADQCPDTPKGVKVDTKGCPIDTDKDGIADYLDKCPTVAGIAKFDGCPDTDGDGIQDAVDKCPTVAGLPEYEGCPKPEEVVEAVTINIPSIENVLFETSKNVIRPQYKAILDNAVKFLKENPNAKVVIAGHTDDKSDDIYNQKLSEKRADAVKQYLVKKGINKARISTQGFGEKAPAADNATEEGRTANRRSEVKIVL